MEQYKRIKANYLHKLLHELEQRLRKYEIGEDIYYIERDEIFMKLQQLEEVM